MLSTATLDANKALSVLGFSITSEYVKPTNGIDWKTHMMEWTVTLFFDGRKILSTSYSMGLGHIPNFPHGRISMYDAEHLTDMLLNGKAPLFPRHAKIREMPTPQLADVVYSLKFDLETLDYSTFEEWANNTGYNPDSRKAEGIYRKCMDHALALRNGVPTDVWEKVDTILQEY